MKPDFSDLYRFRVSIGLFLIALAVVAPWAFYREQFDLLVSQTDLNALTKRSQDTIQLRQFIVWALTWVVPVFSVVCIIAGAIALVPAYRAWVKIQEKLDEMMEIDLIVKRAGIKPTSSLISPNESAEREMATTDMGTIQDQEESQRTVPAKEIESPAVTKRRPETLRLLSEVHNAISRKLQDCVSDSYRVMNDVSIRDVPFDFLLLDKGSSPHDIAISAWSQRSGLSLLERELPQQDLSALRYRRDTGRELTVICILNDSSLSEAFPVPGENPKEIESLQESYPSTRVHIVNTSKFDALGCDEIRSWISKARNT